MQAGIKIGRGIHSTENQGFTLFHEFTIMIVINNKRKDGSRYGIDK